MKLKTILKSSQQEDCSPRVDQEMWSEWNSIYDNIYKKVELLK